jgi:hypothetical protein
MLKSLAVLAIASIGVLAAQSLPKQAIAKEPIGASAQVSTTPDNKQGDSKVTVIVKQENAAPQEGHGAENPDDIQIQKSNLRLTGWLVIVGGLQAVILFFTIRAINKQNATNQHIERAWVMVELRCGPETHLFTGEHTENGVTKPSVTMMGVEMHSINDGNSPAWISEKSARVVVAREDELPLIPVIGPNDIIQNQPDPLGPGRDSVFKWDATGEGQYSPLQAATLIYGVVRYRDIFNNDRETWFCYQMMGYKTNRKLVRVAAPPEYNKNT